MLAHFTGTVDTPEREFRNILMTLVGIPLSYLILLPYTLKALNRNPLNSLNSLNPLNPLNPPKP